MTEHDSMRRLLEETTIDVTPPPAFAGRVLTGARRRRRTGRLLLATTAVVALAAAGFGLPPLLRGTNELAQAGPVIAAQQWLSGPTLGNLADEQEFLDGAIEKWESAAASFYRPEESATPEGAPHVVVATETETGPVAVIAQSFTTQGDERVLSGVLGISPDEEFDVLTIKTESGGPLAYLLGPERRSLVAVSPTAPLYASERLVIDEQSGVPSPRTWSELPRTDGLVVTELQPDIEPADLLLSTHPQGNNDDAHPQSITQPWIGVGSGTPYHEGSDEPALDVRLRQGWAPESGDQNLALHVDANGDSQSDHAHDNLIAFDWGMTSAGLGDPNFQFRPASLFTLNVVFSDGRRALIAEQLHTPERAHLYAVVYDEDVVDEVVHAGPTPRESALPVSVQLPDDQGWVVFDYQAGLRYRDSTESEWQDVDTEWGAALLPASATQVEVTDPEGDVAVVDLAG